MREVCHWQKCQIAKRKEIKKRKTKNKQRKKVVQWSKEGIKKIKEKKIEWEQNPLPRVAVNKCLHKHRTRRRLWESNLPHLVKGLLPVITSPFRGRITHTHTASVGGRWEEKSFWQAIPHTCIVAQTSCRWPVIKENHHKSTRRGWGSRTQLSWNEKKVLLKGRERESSYGQTNDAGQRHPKVSRLDRWAICGSVGVGWDICKILLGF